MTNKEIPAVPRTASPQEIAALLKESGAVRVLNLVDESVMDRMEAELWPTVERTAPGPNEILGFKTRRVSAIVAKSSAAGELALNPLILGIAGEVLDQFQLHLSQAICLSPGQAAQLLHRDDLVYPELRHPVDKELVINVIWAVSEFTERVGATRAIYGSHRWDDAREPREEETVPAVMPRGSALVYLGSIWHGGGANRSTDQVRFAASIAYSRNWLRQEENQYLAIPPHVAKGLPEQLQRLIGYGKLGYLGWVDLKDPIDLLRNGEL